MSHQISLVSHRISWWATTSRDEPPYLPMSHYTYLLMSHYISLWAPTSPHELPHLLISHNISWWAIISPDEPPHIPMSHHISLWATISPHEPPHFLMSHHISWWATPSHYEPPYIPPISPLPHTQQKYCRVYTYEYVPHFRCRLSPPRVYWPSYVGLLYTETGRTELSVCTLRQVRLQ